MVVKRSRQAVTEPINPVNDNGLDDGNAFEEDSDLALAYESYRAITDSDVKVVFPQASLQSKIVNADYRFPDIPEATLQSLKKLKTEWVIGNELFLENAQRVSVHVLNETAKTHSLDRDQAKDRLGDMISEIDKKLRSLRFPVTTDKMFDPNALDEYFKLVKDLERYIDLYAKAYDNHLPVLDQLEEAQQKHDELVKEIERIEMSLRESQDYAEPIVDPDDYTQSLLLFNSNTLNLFTS